MFQYTHIRFHTHSVLYIAYMHNSSALLPPFRCAHQRQIRYKYITCYMVLICLYTHTHKPTTYRYMYNILYIAKHITLHTNTEHTKTQTRTRSFCCTVYCVLCTHVFMPCHTPYSIHILCYKPSGWVLVENGWSGMCVVRLSIVNMVVLFDDWKTFRSFLLYPA